MWQFAFISSHFKTLSCYQPSIPIAFITSLIYNELVNEEDFGDFSMLKYGRLMNIIRWLDLLAAKVWPMLLSA